MPFIRIIDHVNDIIQTISRFLHDARNALNILSHINTAYLRRQRHRVLIASKASLRMLSSEQRRLKINVIIPEKCLQIITFSIIQHNDKRMCAFDSLAEDTCFINIARQILDKG